MKKLSIIFATLLSCFLIGCMDNNEYPADYVPGNPSIGAANTSIADLKTKFLSVTSANGVKMIEDDIIISGVVVGDDESGNIYKSIYINDGTATIQIAINTSGIYATFPVGQTIVVDCKGLYIGGYGTMPQIGSLYEGEIGRMSEITWLNHVRLEGRPVMEHPVVKNPIEVDEAWLKAAEETSAPYFVRFNSVKIKEADGEAIYAPEEEADKGYGVNRKIQIGGTSMTFRISTYANFATDIMPEGDLTMTGMLTVYNGTWQFTVRTIRDIKTNE
ncbi:MAG: hypothetical protein J6J76_07875 [Paraprevotella sp.]|nr:hypothetical protein [Paraprevotella sp.]